MRSRLGAFVLCINSQYDNCLPRGRVQPTLVMRNVHRCALRSMGSQWRIGPIARLVLVIVQFNKMPMHSNCMDLTDLLRWALTSNTFSCKLRLSVLSPATLFNNDAFNDYLLHFFGIEIHFSVKDSSKKFLYSTSSLKHSLSNPPFPLHTYIWINLCTGAATIRAQEN